MFCKSSSSGLLVLQFLKSLFTAVKRMQFLVCTFNNSVHKIIVSKVLFLITPFKSMFLIGNLRVHCLERDYPVNSSRLPADLSWISFVLEDALWEILYLIWKMYKTLYNNYKFFPVQCVINQANWKTTLIRKI